MIRTSLTLTPAVTAQMLGTLANKTNAEQLWVVGDIIACQRRASRGAGQILEAPDIHKILGAYFERGITDAFLHALDEGQLRGCSYDGNNKLFTRGPSLPDQYEAPHPRSATVHRLAVPTRPKPKAKPKPKPQPTSSPQSRPAPKPRPQAIVASRPVPRSVAIHASTTGPAIGASSLSEDEAKIVADLYGPAKEFAAHIGQNVFAITQPDIPLQMLKHIAKKHFERAVFLTLGAPRYSDGRVIPIKEGQEIYLTAGAYFQVDDRIEECIFVSRLSPKTRVSYDYPKVKLRYHNAEWVALNRDISGRNAIYLLHAVLTRTIWGIKHNGQPFRESRSKHPIPPEDRALREAILEMTDKTVDLSK